MKVFSVIGLTGSGKTTTIEMLIKSLVARGYSVGTVKEIHYEAFRIDTDGKNTARHRASGAGTVTALGYHETDVMYVGKMPIYDVLRHYTEDYVILEGVRSANVPNISVAKTEQELDITPLTIAVSGVFSNGQNRFASGSEAPNQSASGSEAPNVNSGECGDEYNGLPIINALTGIDPHTSDAESKHHNEYNGLPVINALTDIETLTDLVIKKTPDLMNDFDLECCGHCGYSCRGYLAKILAERESEGKCILAKSSVSVKLDGEELPLVPFVEKLVKNSVMAVVGELKGYKSGRTIEVTFKDINK